MEDPLTIQNTIKNGIAPELSILDVSTTDEEDEPTSPSDAPVRRKSVTFSNEEPFIGTAASEGKKKKKEKKKSNTMASTNRDYRKHPYTHLVKSLPPVPVNDTFLQTLHDKLIANLPQ
ncbi:hypothetical protein G6F56_013179 [Rhizopus delemar]|nr:hypothetical protein G6F56_013179 [Rhizopus delemar]